MNSLFAFISGYDKIKLSMRLYQICKRKYSEVTYEKENCNNTPGICYGNEPGILYS